MDKQTEENTAMIYIRIVEDDDLFSAFLNADELLDELALAARESSHAKAAYEILRCGERRRDPDPRGPSFHD